MRAYAIHSKPHPTRDRASASAAEGQKIRFFTPMQLSENMHETPEGYLVCLNVPIARVGEQLYGRGETPLECGPDGCVIIERDPKEVFRHETIASFEGKSFTIYHPEQFVSPENWNQLTMGVVQNVRRGSGEHEGSLIADLLITAKRAIELVKGGLREISCGYEAEYIQTGVGRGRQVNIVGNHVALVDEGRAGSSHAIKDHKGKVAMSLKDKIKGIFGKAQDDALKLVDQTDGGSDPGDEDDEDADKAAKTFDARMARMEKMLAKLAGKTKDDMGSTQPSNIEPAKVQAVDDVETRLAKLEEMVSKLMERESKEDEVPVGDEEVEVVEDADEEGEEAEDADEEGEEAEDAEEGEEAEDEYCGASEEKKKGKVGDAKSRVEILAPGMSTDGKDVMKKALVAAFATRDGKAAILKLTGGKKPDFKDAKAVKMLFLGASELLANERTGALARTRTADSFQSMLDVPKGAMTAEQMNEANAKHYAPKH